MSLDPVQEMLATERPVFELEELFRVPPPTYVDSRGRWIPQIPRMRPPGTSAALLQIMQAYPGCSFTVTELAARLGRDRLGPIRQRLYLLVRKGCVQRVGCGRFVAVRWSER